MYFCQIAASCLLSYSYISIAFYTLHYGSVRRLVPSRNSSTHLYVAKLQCRPTADSRTALASVPSSLGGFGGLSPPQTKLQNPQIETWSTIHQWRFGQFLECQPPSHKCKAPRRTAKPPTEKFLATVLTGISPEIVFSFSFWRLGSLRTLWLRWNHNNVMQLLSLV